jgi:hypothetical protein
MRVRQPVRLDPNVRQSAPFCARTSLLLFLLAGLFHRDGTPVLRPLSAPLARVQGRCYNLDAELNTVAGRNLEGSMAAIGAILPSVITISTPEDRARYMIDGLHRAPGPYGSTGFLPVGHSSVSPKAREKSGPWIEVGEMS